MKLFRRINEKPAVYRETSSVGQKSISFALEQKSIYSPYDDNADFRQEIETTAIIDAYKRFYDKSVEHGRTGGLAPRETRWPKELSKYLLQDYLERNPDKVINPHLVTGALYNSLTQRKSLELIELPESGHLRKIVELLKRQEFELPSERKIRRDIKEDVDFLKENLKKMDR